ncbi:hypothetical protein LO80_08095 [Candidatus Francisella endociliophora]|uniref:Lipoprotein n=1 Tax=Candidatus Francisella endociliophora TaxID=653937 RepID=A0A097EQU2_9GAMM|nr:hypothetical protein [Francisella sp. FSC1006]AIT09931.1 hypothetical protein LO80_08095 [Francisella sp. FSC1006]
MKLKILFSVSLAGALLSSCINEIDDNKSTESFNGDYAADGYVVGTFPAPSGINFKITNTSASWSCPAGWVIPKALESIPYGSSVSITNVSSSSQEALQSDLSPGSLVSYDFEGSRPSGSGFGLGNNSTYMSAICVKNPSISVWQVS